MQHINFATIEVAHATEVSGRNSNTGSVLKNKVVCGTSTS
jgi:hypothetical protein